MPRRSHEVKLCYQELDIIKEALIQEVKELPILWDLAHQHYNYINMKDNAWDSIKDSLREHFGLDTFAKHKLETRQALKELWKNLRAQYASNKRNRKGASGAGANEVKLIKWRLFQQMSFLERTVVAIPTANSMRFEINEAGDDTEDDPLPSTLMGSDRDDPLPSALMRSDRNDSSLSALPEIMQDEPQPLASNSAAGIYRQQEPHTNRSMASYDEGVTPWSPSQQRKRRPVKNTTSTARQEREEAFKEALKVLKKPESPNMAFCRYLSTLLDKVPDEEQDRLQFELIKSVNAVLEQKRQ